MKRRLLDFLYNADRAIASLFGAPPQETISSAVRRESPISIPFATTLFSLALQRW